MAEIAAGAVVAEELVSTTIQGSVAAYAVAKPTMPLKATFNQIAITHGDETRLSLARSHHTVTVVGDQAFIWGGETASGQLLSTDMHSIRLSPTKETPGPEYSIVPAVPDTVDGPLPATRTQHAACKLNVCVAVFGGRDDTGAVIDDSSVIWLFNVAKQAWEPLRAAKSDIAPVPRANAQLFELNNNLILFGGTDAQHQPLKDVWQFEYASQTWKPFESAPISTSNAVVADGTLYLISASDAVSSDLHSLDLRNFDSTWTESSFPTNPLTPGPRPRVGGGLVAISTGYGRHYLLYFLGARQNPTTASTTAPEDTSDPTQWSDIWTLQLPSSSPELKPTLSLSDAIKPAKIKDVIRSKLGYDSGEQSWSEVEVVPPGDLETVSGGSSGKIHPGPRAYFGCDVMSDGVSVVLWGGLNAKGEREGDGWIVKLA